MSTLPIKEGQIRQGSNLIAKNAAVFLRHEEKLTQLVMKADLTVRDIEICRFEMQPNDVLIVCTPGTNAVAPENVALLITMGVCCVVVEGNFQKIPDYYAKISKMIAMENISSGQVARFLASKFA